MNENAALHGRQRLRFIAGIVLIVISFLVYPAYPMIILFLRYSPRVKFDLIVVLSFLSWIVFSVGIMLAGLEGYEWLKNLWKRKTD